MSDETYDDGRARTLEQLLRALAERIRELDAAGRLLANPAELTRLVGDVKSELFHYEVQGDAWQQRGRKDDGDDAPEW